MTRSSISGSRLRTAAEAADARPSQPYGQVLLEAADAVEHVVHPAAGQLLHHRLEGLALAEGVEDRRDRAELERVGAEEHQVVQHPVELGQQGAQPDRADRDLHAQHPLDREDDAELVAERGQPVVPVRQHDDLPVVADLEQLLRAAVHVADDRLAVDDPLAVQGQPQPEHAVGGRVLRADVEHHVGGRQLRAAAGPAPLVRRVESRRSRADSDHSFSTHDPSGRGWCSLALLTPRHAPRRVGGASTMKPASRTLLRLAMHAPGRQQHSTCTTHGTLS